MKEIIDLSINPCYGCNFRCSFCYLTGEQLGSHQVLELDTLEHKLKEARLQRRIRHIDVYGGEVGLLPESYLGELLELALFYAVKSVNVVTNLSVLHPLFADERYTLSVSWDGPFRRDGDKVLGHILSLGRLVHILMLASPPMLKWGEEDIRKMANLFNSMSNVLTVEIKPYSSNQANQWPASYRAYEEFVAKWIDLAPFRFELINQKSIEKALRGERNAWSDDHLYITPDGEWAVLDFDSQGREYFLSLPDWEAYLRWCEREKERVKSDPWCGDCRYLGHCLSEHLRGGILPERSNDDSCDGFKGLLDGYAQRC